MATCPSCRKQYADDVKFCPKDGETLLSDAAFSGVDPDLDHGQVVGEYEVERKIGAGGFGSVYRAVHPLIGKTVAIKVLSREYSSNPQMVSRFIEEARAVNQIRHRNIIDIFSFGLLADKRQYFVMEYLDGQPFDQYLQQRGRLTVEEAVPLLRQVARALDAAHGAGIVHRDLKPENVYLTFDEDGRAFPKLLDFGIAKLLGDASGGGHKTATGQPIGTPYYMAPEQCLGKGVDHGTDVYAFGVMCHEVLAGKLPFMAEEMMNVLVMQMSKEPPSMSSVCPALPAALDAPVLQMLAKDPALRPESVQAALEQLAQAALDAGFDVQVATVRRGGKSTPGVISRPISTPVDKLTPSEAAAMGSAQTVALDETASVPPAASSAPSQPTARVPSQTPAGAAITAGDLMAPTERSPGQRSRGKAVGIAAAVVAALAVAAVMLLRGGLGAGSDAEIGATGAATDEPAPATSADQDPVKATASDTGESSSAPPAAQMVELQIQSQPPHVEVWLDDQKLGTAPGPIELAQGDEKLELTFKAPGYQPKTLELTPSANSVVAVQLARARRPAGGKPTGKPASSGKGDLIF